VQLLTISGLQFKDLNRNGKLDRFEDWRLSPDERADDLLRQLTIEDMAGLMVHGTLPAVGGGEASIGRGAGYDLEKSKELIAGRRISTFITRLRGAPEKIAGANNEIAPSEAKAHGLVVVDTPDEADVAIIRAETPADMLNPGYFFGSRQHEGRLNLQPGDAAYDALMKCGKTPAVMTVYMDRPAILTDVKDKVSTLYADFGVSDGSLLEILMGRGKAQGRLPFELPSSMAAVTGQKSDVPHDSVKPLYPYGYALQP